MKVRLFENLDDVRVAEALSARNALWIEKTHAFGRVFHEKSVVAEESEKAAKRR